MALGDILIVDNITFKFYRYSGGAWDSGFTIPGGGQPSPSGIAVDPTNGDVLMVHSATDLIYRYSGGSWDSGFSVPTGVGDPRGLAVDPTNNDILLLAGFTGAVYRYSGSSWDSGFNGPRYLSDPDDPTSFRAGSGQGITVAPNGDILVVVIRDFDDGTEDSVVYRYSGGSWDSGFAIPTGEASPRGLAVDPTNNNILIVGTGTDKVYRYSSGSWDSGFALPSGVGTPGGVAIDGFDPYVSAAGDLDGGLTGTIAGVAGFHLPLEAAGDLDGGLTGTVGGAANIQAAPAPLEAAGDLDGALTGTVAGAGYLIASALRGFTATGQIHMLMRVTVGLFTRGNGQENLWASSLWTADGSSGQVGTLDAGSPTMAGVDGDDPILRRFARWSSGNRLILNTDGTGNVGDLFDETADPQRLTVIILGDSGFDLFTLPPPSSGGGGSFVDWRGSDDDLSDEQWDLLDGLAAGDEVILAVHRGTAAYEASLLADGALDGALTGTLAGAGFLVAAPSPLEAAADLDGDLTGTVAGDSFLVPVPSPLEAAGALDAGLTGTLAGAGFLVVVSPPLEAAAALDGALTGTLAGVAYIDVPLEAAGDLDAGLTGTIAGAATTIAAEPPLEAAGALDGALTGTPGGAAFLVPVLTTTADLDGGLTGTIGADAIFGTVLAAGNLSGALAGTIEGQAAITAVRPPDPAFRNWLTSLRMPFDVLARRWAVMLSMADIGQRMINSAGAALRDWWPTTCRPSALATWARTLRLPQRSGESADDYRRRVALWRTEPVGTSGWLRSEVKRVTGHERVIEFPRDGGRAGYSRMGTVRLGAGPSLTIGVEDRDRRELEEAIMHGIPVDAGVNFVTPDVFDRL